MGGKYHNGCKCNRGGSVPDSTQGEERNVVMIFRFEPDEELSASQKEHSILCVIYIQSTAYTVDRVSSVGIATRYGLHNPVGV